MRVLAATQTAYATESAQPARTTPPPDRLALVINQPKVIALKWPTGKPVKSPKSGKVDVMFSLAQPDPRCDPSQRAFFPQHVADAIASLHLGHQEPFQIIKLPGDDWDIERVSNGGRTAAGMTGAAGTERKVSPAASAAPTAQLSSQSTPAPAPLGKVNGQGEDIPAIMRRCYHAAIEIALDATETARVRGLMLSPSFEDIRAMAATLCINETGGRR